MSCNCVPHDTECEMEVGMQKRDWGVLLGSILWGSEDGITGEREREREKVNCVCCSCKKNLTRVAVQCSSHSELS